MSFQHLFAAQIDNLRAHAYTEHMPVENISYEDLESGEQSVGETRMRLKSRIQFPPHYAGKTVALLIRMKISQPEVVSAGLLYINGRPFQGIDAFHQEVVLTDSAREGEILDIVLDLSQRKEIVPTGSRRPLISNSIENTAVLETAVRKREIWELLHHLRFVICLLESLPDGDISGEKLEKEIGEILSGFSEERSEKQAREAQRHILLLLKQKVIPNTTRALCFGHAHIDLAWLWPISETICKCGRTFSTILRLMAEYPEFVFVQTSAPFYLWTQKHYPELWSEIKKRVSEGRWEVNTGMWIESDTNLTSGESLIRQILWGKTFAKEMFGIEVETLWLPDTFGFTAALPQLMKKSGLKNFATIKITWNDTNEFPYHTFWWQGLDGSKVLAHIPPSGNYNSILDYSSLIESKENFLKRKPGNGKVFLYPYGFGDGGGGPTAEMLENSRICSKYLDNPKIEHQGISSGFQAIAESLEDIPRWAGELYLEEHRGTYTTQGKIKKANRKAEILYRNAELLAAFAYAFGNSYPQKMLHMGWEKILNNQFHDILPGSSIREVYETAALDYKEINKIGEQVLSRSASYLMQKIDTRGEGMPLVVFNTLSWERNDAVIFQTDEMFKVFDQNKEIPAQCIKHHGKPALLFFARKVPGMGYKTYYLKKGNPVFFTSSLRVSETLMENAYFRVSLNHNGNLASIYDKRHDREILEGEGNRWQIFKDIPDEWDAWNIDSDYEKYGQEITKIESVEVVESGPLRCVLRIERSIGEHSSAAQEIVLWSELPRIDFCCGVNWKEHRKLLKVNFPVAVHSLEATAEIQFGHVKRATHRNTSFEQARYEFPAHKWVDISEAHYGVSLLNDCKYGYDILENRIRLTLLRSPKQPDKQADMGEHRFSYALWPHLGNMAAGDTVYAGYEFNVPLLAFAENPHTGILPPVHGFLEIDGKGAILETVKHAHRDKRIIFRIYEALGGSLTPAIKSRLPLCDFAGCDLLERPDGETFNAKEGEMRFRLGPFEVKTIAACKK